MAKLYIHTYIPHVLFAYVFKFPVLEESRQRLSSGSSQDEIGNTPTQSGKGKKKKLSAVDKSKKHLFSKPVVLRLLAELTKSYPAVAKLITEHVYLSRSNDKMAKVLYSLHFSFSLGPCKNLKLCETDTHIGYSSKQN